MNKLDFRPLSSQSQWQVETQYSSYWIESVLKLVLPVPSAADKDQPSLNWDYAIHSQSGFGLAGLSNQCPMQRVVEVG